jgi:hypothetical protein
LTFFYGFSGLRLIFLGAGMRQSRPKCKIFGQASTIQDRIEIVPRYSYGEVYKLIAMVIRDLDRWVRKKEKKEKKEEEERKESYNSSFA